MRRGSFFNSLMKSGAMSSVAPPSFWRMMGARRAQPSSVNFTVRFTIGPQQMVCALGGSCATALKLYSYTVVSKLASAASTPCAWPNLSC